MSYIIVMVTTPSKEEALKIVRWLLDDRLIACANIVGPASSLFRWKDKIDEATEFLIFMKSREELFQRLSEGVKQLHSYQVPEIISLPILAGSPPYLNWLDACLKPVKRRG
jgi:periplasmic divalent cation tolerance protein